jgi:hypothetical protein
MPRISSLTICIISFLSFPTEVCLLYAPTKGVIHTLTCHERHYLCREVLILRKGERNSCPYLIGLRGGNGRDSDADIMSDRENSEEDDFVTLQIENTCNERREIITVSVSAYTRIEDLKRSLYANFTYSVCEVERMQLLWEGQELQSFTDETLSLYGIDGSVPNPKILLKDAGVDRGFQVNNPGAYSTDSGFMPGESSQEASISNMLSMMDPSKLKLFIQKNPQMQEMLKTNPEVPARPASTLLSSRDTRRLRAPGPRARHCRTQSPCAPRPVASRSAACLLRQS